MSNKIVCIEVLFRFISRFAQKAGAFVAGHSTPAGSVYGVLISEDTARPWL